MSHDPTGLRQVRDLQERAARAVPATVQESTDGCWLRYTDSPTTWWAGAALVHGAHQAQDLGSRIAVAEEFYTAHGARARFQVCPACPPDLDHELAVRGYRWCGAMSLQVCTTGHLARHLSAPALCVDLADHPDSEWFDLLMTAQGLGGDPDAEWRLLQRVEQPCTYARAHVSGRPVAVGRAVADTGWVGVFGMATLPGARHQGAAGAVLARLAEWAGRQGCSHMYLQVTHDSTAALAFYRGAGFEEACTYHYRTAGESRSARAPYRPVGI